MQAAHGSGGEAGERMTTRATFTAAEMARAIRAADAAGKVAVLTPAGIVFADADRVALPSPPPADPFDLVDMSR